MTPADQADGHNYLAREARARVEIDKQLAAAGWAVQSQTAVNLGASRGVAVREFTLEPPHGRVDYLLFVDGQPAGVIEAKPEGTTLVEVEHQSGRYVNGLPDWMTPPVYPLPFIYESTGAETRFTNGYDPDARSRRVFTFHRPETLADWSQQIVSDPDRPTFRARLRQMPPVDKSPLWGKQPDAVRNVERSLAEDRPRSLVQMATGSGKTFTAATISYRLIKHADAKRVLFPRRSVESRQADEGGVRQVHDPRDAAEVPGRVQRAAPHVQHARHDESGVHLDGAADLLHAEG